MTNDDESRELRFGTRRAFTAIAPVLVSMAAGIAGSAAAEPQASSGAANADTAAVALREATAAYVAAVNARDYDALAAQWCRRATLVEGGTTLRGRDAIMTSLRTWFDRHPGSTLAIEITAIERLAEPLARVSGILRFSPAPGAASVESRFESLRVLEEGSWRLLESLVAVAPESALDDLDWLLGTWRADDEGQIAAGGPPAGDQQKPGRRAEMSVSRRLGGKVIVIEGRLTPGAGSSGGGSPAAAGPAGGGIEFLEIIWPDRAAGVVRGLVCDSTGARAESVFAVDVTAEPTGAPAIIEETLVGISSAGGGRAARWTRRFLPAGPDAFTLHATDRSIDGIAVPDGRPLRYTRLRDESTR